MYKFNKQNKAQLALSFILLIQTTCEKKVEQTGVNDVNSNQIANLTEPSNDKAELSANYENAVPPILIHKVTKREGKLPLQIYYFDLEFKSRQNNHTWLLINNHPGDPLPESGIFDGDADFKNPISADEYSGERDQGKIVLIQFYGSEGFRAIRLPKQGKIKFAPFQLESFSDISVIEVWEVRALLINGKTPLEEWLPFNTASQATTHSLKDRSGESRRLEFDQNTNQIRTDYPQEKVKFIEARGIRKWNIPFKLSVDKN